MNSMLDEYRKYIEKDAALERRFQPVLVLEPSEEDTIAILRGIKESSKRGRMTAWARYFRCHLTPARDSIRAKPCG